MMKCLSVMSVVLSIVLCNSTLAEEAKEPGPNYKHLKPLEWTIGEWVFERELKADSPRGKKGDKGGISIKSEWGLNKNVILAITKYSLNGKVMVEQRQISGWDAEKGCIVMYRFGTSGGSWRGTVSEVTDDSITTKQRFIGHDGATHESITVLTQVDQNTMRFAATIIAEDGEETRRQPLDFTRK